MNWYRVTAHADGRMFYTRLAAESFDDVYRIFVILYPNANFIDALNEGAVEE
jgi:hypothetical protein